MNQVAVEKTEKYLIVKIPLSSVSSGRASISAKSKNIINKAVAEGLADIRTGKVFGPFESVSAFKAALKKR